jgi:hypothetical protein
MIDLPTIAMPKRVAAAAKTLAEREADLEAARKRVNEANAAIQLAVIEDRNLLADSLDAGKRDPGTPNEDEARARLADAERLAEGEELRAQRARDELDAALSETIEGWQAKLAQEVEKAEADVLRLLDEVEAAELERGRRRIALTWAYRYRSGQKLPRLDFVAPTASTLQRHPNDPSTYAVTELIGAVRTGVERATLAREAERATERERREAEAEARRRKIAQARAAVPRP